LASTSFDSSALWLPVADLPAETDGWLPSLAPDEQTSPVTESGQEPASGTDALLGDLPHGTYGDDFPPLLDPDGAESTNVIPVHIEPETSEPEDLAQDSESRAELEPGGPSLGLDGDGSDRDDEQPDGPAEDHTPSVASTPVDDVPLDEPLVDVPVAGGSPAAEASETDDRGPDRVAAERPASAAPTGRASSSSDEHGELEGWPGFDEQVRV
jgi:hypothetical protein